MAAWGTGSPHVSQAIIVHLCQCLWPLQRDRQSVQLQLRRHNGGRSGTARARRRSRQSLAPATASRQHAGVNLIDKNAAPGGAKEDRVSTPDQNLDGALCLRSLATGKDATTGTPLTGTARDQARRIGEGVEDIIASGNLHRTPAVFIHRPERRHPSAELASRAYFGLNNVVEGSVSSLHYYEVTNAHHLDSFNQFPGYNAMFIPLHRYFIQAMDLMYDHLRHGRALPPSQVVHTTPRGVGAPPDHGPPTCRRSQTLHPRMH